MAWGDDDDEEEALPARTETADKGRAPQWEHRALLGFERGKHATETFFARRRVDVQLWAEAGGFGKFFGGEDALLAQADFKLSELVSNDRWGCELPMRDPATDDRTPVAYIKLAFRLRWPIDYTPPKEERPSRGGRASAGSAGGGGGGGGAVKAGKDERGRTYLVHNIVFSPRHDLEPQLLLLLVLLVQFPTERPKAIPAPTVLLVAKTKSVHSNRSLWLTSIANVRK